MTSHVPPNRNDSDADVRCITHSHWTEPNNVRYLFSSFHGFFLITFVPPIEFMFLKRIVTYTIAGCYVLLILGLHFLFVHNR